MKRSKTVMIVRKEDDLDRSALSLLGHWAKIEHTDGENGRHVHYMIEAGNLLPLSSYAENLGVPVNQIQAMSNLRATARYMLHLDSPEKELYARSEIVTNDDEWFDALIKSNKETREENIQILQTIRNMNYVDATTYLFRAGFGISQVYTFLKIKEMLTGYYENDKI